MSSIFCAFFFLLFCDYERLSTTSFPADEIELITIRCLCKYIWRICSMPKAFFLLKSLRPSILLQYCIPSGYSITLSLRHLLITSKMDTDFQPGICDKCKKQTVVQVGQSDELLCHDCYKEPKKQAESSEKEKDTSPLKWRMMKMKRTRVTK